MCLWSHGASPQLHWPPCPLPARPHATALRTSQPEQYVSRGVRWKTQVGQFLSTVRSLPTWYQDALATLQDGAPSRPFDKVRATIMCAARPLLGADFAHMACCCFHSLGLLAVPSHAESQSASSRRLAVRSWERRGSTPHSNTSTQKQPPPLRWHRRGHRAPLSAPSYKALSASRPRSQKPPMISATTPASFRCTGRR